MKLSFRERLSYGLGTTGEQFPNFIIQTYLFFYFNMVVGLNAAVIGTIMLVARVWDAINDPMMGAIADRTRTRWGSYRPWAFFATIPMGIFLVLTFTNVDLTGGAKAIYCAAMYILFGMSNTASLIPLGSMLNVMTDDNQERSVLGSFREFGSSIGNLVGSIAVPLIVTAFINSGMGEARGYQMTALVLSILCFVMLAITFFNTKERIAPPAGSGQGFFASFKVLKGNVPGICLIFFFFFITTAIITRQMFNAYYAGFVLQDDSMTGTLLMVMSIAPFFILYFIPKIAGRYGKRFQLILGCVIVVVGGILFYAAGTGKVMNLAASFVVGLGQVLTFSGVWASLPDAADYGEYVNGIHAPGVLYSIANFGLKIGMSAAGVLLSIGLAASGFDETAAVQAAGVADGLRAFNALSLILPTVCAALCVIPYKLTAQRATEIARELAARRSAG